MRKIKDGIYNTITYLFSSFGILVLGALIYFIFSNGLSSFSLKLFTSDYYGFTYNSEVVNNRTELFTDPKIDGSYFSKVWGVALKDSQDKEKNQVVVITYIDKYSPFNNAINKSNQEHFSITVGQELDKVFLEDENGELLIGLSKYKASSLAQTLDDGVKITDMITISSGGGIKGSIIATLYLIVLTLIIAIPIGIASAIYLNEYAKESKVTRAIRNMIEMTSGIPSIIFGLVGAIIFIPMMNKLINSNGGSIASGALTLSIILLPIIIRTTEESLKVIPQGYRHASLALGASETQTTFKVVLPNALSGILASVLLSIGRIIGESAALIYAIGTVIKDDIVINEKATSLAVHIWILMGGEVPNFELASTISILILIIVFSLSLIVKILTKKLNKYEVK